MLAFQKIVYVVVFSLKTDFVLANSVDHGAPGSLLFLGVTSIQRDNISIVLLLPIKCLSN